MGSSKSTSLAIVTGEVIAWRKIDWDSNKRGAVFGPTKSKTDSKGLWVAEAATYSVLLWNSRFILGTNNNSKDYKRFMAALKVMADPEKRTQFLVQSNQMR